jgi:hypothetical protein
VLLPWLGACYCHGWERVTVLVLIQAKAFADDISGDGNGALWASFFPAGAPLWGTRLCSTKSPSENLSVEDV